MQSYRPMLMYGMIVVVSLSLIYAHKSNTEDQYQNERSHFVQLSNAAAEREAQKAEDVFQSIYENIRTISQLPSVAKIDRHATNLGADGRKTIQQIYNNLASSVSISEVYVVPVDFDPARFDPAIGKTEEPIIMFDELIINAGKFSKKTDPFAAAAEEGDTEPELEELEVHEYRQLKRHQDWLKQHYPTIDTIEGLNVPMISGEEVITCDNTHYASTLIDADRSGLMFSVPFYGEKGALKGTITAIILSKAVREFVPAKNFALTNSASSYVSRGHKDGQETRSAEWVAKAQPDPNLIASSTIKLTAHDPRSVWTMWSGRPNSTFYTSPAYQHVKLLEIGGYAAITMVMLAALASWWLYIQNLKAVQIRTQEVEENAAKIKSAHDVAVKAELEAVEMAGQLQQVNEEVIKLNRELESNMKKLSEAQDEIVRKGKMAQLGQLTATIAHEIRNPLGAVRTSAFLIGRKFKDGNPGIEKPLDRINAGIVRCDSIISELLDFARSKELQLQESDFDGWLTELVQKQAEQFPQQVAIELQLGLGGANVWFDPNSFNRAVINFLSNASEAMIGKGTDLPAEPTVDPKIVVSTKRTMRGIEISITDNGPGIDEENMAKILEPLFTTKSFGVGLGLPAVQKIFEQHQGGMEIESSPGHGATFRGWFPLAQSSRQAA